MRTEVRQTDHKLRDLSLFTARQVRQTFLEFCIILTQPRMADLQNHIYTVLYTITRSLFFLTGKTLIILYEIIRFAIFPHLFVQYCVYYVLQCLLPELNIIVEDLFKTSFTVHKNKYQNATAEVMLYSYTNLGPALGTSHWSHPGKMLCLVTK